MASSSSSSQQKLPEENQPQGGMFECSTCGLKERYHYFGKKPPFARHFVFHEDSYIARDLFSPKDRTLFLFLGAKCSVCDKDVCQRQECSFFYTRRFCIPCAAKHPEEFPAEIHKLLDP